MNTLEEHLEHTLKTLGTHLEHTLDLNGSLAHKLWKLSCKELFEK